MGKNVGLTYVDEFSFPAEQGFTGSAGVHKVRGYMRGGHVKKTGTANAAEGGYYGKPGDKYAKSKARQKMPANVKKKGGPVKKQMGGFVGPEREISVDDVTISVPKKHGGKMSTHDKLYKEGGKMGYAYGGQVKPSNTSAQFKMTKGKQDSMDHGVQPARKGRNEAEVEAGGNKRLKAGYRKGGVIKGPKRGPMHQVAYKGLKKLKGVMSEGDRAHARRIASGRRMPKGVKAKGGLAKYAAGGLAKKVVAAQ